MRHDGRKIITPAGKVSFQSNQIGEVINSYSGSNGYDTVYHEEYFIQIPDEQIVTPLGQFSTIALVSTSKNPLESSNVNVEAKSSYVE